MVRSAYCFWATAINRFVRRRELGLYDRSTTGVKSPSVYKFPPQHVLPFNDHCSNPYPLLPPLPAESLAVRDRRDRPAVPGQQV